MKGVYQKCTSDKLATSLQDATRSVSASLHSSFICVCPFIIDTGVERFPVTQHNDADFHQAWPTTNTLCAKSVVGRLSLPTWCHTKLSSRQPHHRRPHHRAVRISGGDIVPPFRSGLPSASAHFRTWRETPAPHEGQEHPAYSRRLSDRRVLPVRAPARSAVFFAAGVFRLLLLFYEQRVLLPSLLRPTRFPRGRRGKRTDKRTSKTLRSGNSSRLPCCPRTSS